MNRVLPLATVLLLLGAARADAASFLGSPDVSAASGAWACAECPPGAAMGVRQFALRGATVEAPEDGVLTSASVQARRIAGVEDPRVAVLRPAEDGVGVTVVASAPLPLTGAVSRTDDLHLPMRRGDSVGFLFRAGEVDLGVRARPRPDGAVQTFGVPCEPCGMDGGTGVELLLDAVLEPDVDGDASGDETQDADGGGLGFDWEDEWFSDFRAGDELDEELVSEPARLPPPASLGLLETRRLRGSRASLRIAVPKAGRLSVSVTLPANRRTGAGPFTTILTGDMRVRRAGRVRVLLTPTPEGARRLARRRSVRTKVVVAYFPRRSSLELLMRSARL